VIGHSLGGTLALHLAVVESEATAGITLVSPSAFGVLEAVTHPLGGLARIPLFVGMRQTMRILAIREQAGRAISRGLGRIGFTRGLATPLFRHPSFIDASVYDALAAEVRPRAFTAAAEATRDYDAATIWSQVACAATVLRGDRDVFVAADDLPRLVALVPRIRAITVPDAGHFAHVERPFEVLDTVGQAR
ncbi:MAG: alpha/beta hydrolase, partial [Leifsonia sp.]